MDYSDPIGCKFQRINTDRIICNKYEFVQLSVVASIISKIGGFFSFLSGVFILLFGTSRIAPWGFMQKYIIPYMTCMICRKSLIKNVAKKYVSTAGIPFVEKVSEMPSSGTLEDRVQIIETLLKED
ncbi:hypothetical protein C1646_672181 [Rhizophagus diaphanus]|nr:hypothetical protein C1646_672181 [Rhizophagus diaphanus] [Rhizophagus sp. MUCL 43196]